MDTNSVTFASKLSAGVSLLVLCLANPALADASGTTTVPGAELPAEYTFEAGDPVVTGVTSVDSPSANAMVDSVPHGTFVQQADSGHEEAVAPGVLTPLAVQITDLFLENATSLSILASATATPGNGLLANAHANVTDAISQVITAPNLDLTATFVNSGDLLIGADASANGTAEIGDVASSADAQLVGGLHQEATVEGGGGGAATVSGTNDGTFTGYASAQASSDGDATADAVFQEAIFMRAQANGAGDGTTLTTFDNNGALGFHSTATSSSTDGNASSSASTGGGEHGLIHIRAASNGVGADTATAVFTNAGGATLSGTASAAAEGYLAAEASSIADGAIVMRGQANGQDDGDVSLTLDNAGSIAFGTDATANATGSASSANALASMSSAIVQTAETGGPDFYVGRSGVDSIANGGEISITGSSSATAPGDAVASTLIQAAILQEAENTGYAETSFSSDGTVAVSGDATASGVNAQAFALGTGIEQEVFGLGAAGDALSAFSNGGDFSVAMSAGATASGSDALAEADATGFSVWGEPVNLDVSNGGNLTVTSNATANGPAYAGATGLEILATWDPTVVIPEEDEGHGHGGGPGEHGEGQNGHGPGEDEGPVVWEDAATNAINGTAANGGTIFVSASASGELAAAAGLKTPQQLNGTDIHAVATGVYLEGAVVNADFTNSGTIRADAATNGGTSEAYGIRVADFAASPIEPGTNDVFRILNDGGSIIARESADFGASWSHGVAIDTSLAPNRADIVFSGDSYIYGDIDVSADDAITVADGRLTFDGLFNPDTELEGSLTTAPGATLYLTDSFHTNPDHAGPAGGYVDSFTVADGGTLALQLPISPLAGSLAGSFSVPLSLTAQSLQLPYPQLVTNTAVLDGTLKLVVSSPNGLYGDYYFWNDIIAANTLNGTFSDVVTSTGSIFLDPQAIYDGDHNGDGVGDGNVDLSLTRVPFNDGQFALTPNQRSAADGIEGVYSPSLTGPFAGMLAEMFVMNDPGAYSSALSNLHGAQYATYMQSLGWMGNRFNGVLTDMGECGALKLDNSKLACRRENAAGIWGNVKYAQENIDSDPAADATGFRSNQLYATVGGDVRIGSAGVLGIGGGYVRNNGDFDWFGGRMDSDGWQLGAYGAYDPGAFYIKGAASYTNLDGTSSRNIEVGSIAGTASATLGAEIWAIGGDFGYRIPARVATVTPYVGLDWVSAKLNGFTESGTSPGRLAVHESAHDFLTSEFGLKLAASLGAIVPEARVGWRHEFNANPAAFTASYAEQPGSVFRIIGPHTSPDAIVAGFDLAADFTDRLVGKLGYQGRFASGVKDNALYGSLLLKLGGPGHASGTSLAEGLQQSLKPTLKLGFEVSGVYDDNIFATPNDKIADFIAILRPSARVQFGDRSTYLEIGGRGELARNADHTSENYSDWTVDWDSRVRLGDGVSFVLNGDYAWTHEARTSPEAVFGLVPTRYQKGYGAAGLLFRSDGWIARLAANGTTYNFDDTPTASGSINNDDRDRTETEFAGRVGHSVTASTNLFTQVSVSQTRYVSAADDFGYHRNSNGVSAVIGLQRGRKDGFSGEIFAGILHRSYDDPNLQDVKTFDVGMLLDWAGSRSEASFRADRGVGETIFPGASAYVHTDGSISFSAAAGPRLAAGITLRGTQYDYIGISRQEFVINTNLWARYWLGKRLYAGLGYDFTQRASNVAGYNYDENRFLLTLGTQLQPRYLDSSGPVGWIGGGQAPAGPYAALLLGHGTLVTGVAGPRELHEYSTAEFGDDGFAYGAAIGYGVTLDPIYLGLEFTATGDGPAWQHGGSRTFSANKNNGIEFSARAGFVTPGRGLVYGRFGYASAHFTTSYDTGVQDILLKGRKSGMGVGFGIEAQAGGASFVRAEYVVNSYRDYDVTFADGARDNFSNSEGQFRLGLGLRLGTSSGSPTPRTDFSGAYAGMFVGHGALITRTAGAREGQASLDATRSGQGGDLGAFAGYGIVASGFYLGAEIEGDMSNIGWSTEGGSDGRSYSSRRQNSFGAAARVGRLIGASAMIYGRVGVVRTRFDTRYQFGDLSVSSNDTRTGLQLGAGLEIGLSAKLRLRAEYASSRYTTYKFYYGNDFENFTHNEDIFRAGILIGF